MLPGVAGCRRTTVGHVLGISGGDPSFRDDDGSAEPITAAALAAFAAGRGSEHAVLTALAAGRLLVPVVAVASEQITDRAAGAAEPRDRGDHDERDAGLADPAGLAELSSLAEKASEMAMPTLIGLDGRRAVPAFTCLEAMHRWQPAARPVPVSSRLVWQAAGEESCAVVIDVAGPVPLAVEGARLAALARGEPPPQPFADPDVREAVVAALANELNVAAFQLAAGDAERDLVIGLTLEPGSGGCDVQELATAVGEAVMARLGGRLRRGVAIGLCPPPAG